MRHKYLILLLFSLIISGCTSPNNTKKLLASINNELEKSYKIKNGYLVAAYDLTKSNTSNSIYATDFVKIINDQLYNKIFLKKLKIRNLKNIELYAAKKVEQITLLALTLNKKYKFLSKSELSIFYNAKRTVKKQNSLSELLRLDKIVTTIPILLPEYKPIISSNYGYRKNPLNKNIRKLHCGIDLVGYKASPIYSSANGIVTSVKRGKGYGNSIEITHKARFKTKYAHLEKIYVKTGDIVLRGQKIGLQGNSGNSTNEHLHFEILLNSKHINPYDFIFYE